MRQMPDDILDAADDELEQIAEDHARKAAQRVRSRPGGGVYRREPDAYDAETRGGAPAISIEGGGTAIGAEFGRRFHDVFGRRVTASSMSRRVFPVPASGRLGYVVGAIIEGDTRRMEDRLSRAIDKRAEAEFRRRGI